MARIADIAVKTIDVLIVTLIFTVLT